MSPFEAFMVTAIPGGTLSWLVTFWHFRRPSSGVANAV